jgi:hypothetical protein
MNSKHFSWALPALASTLMSQALAADPRTVSDNPVSTGVTLVLGVTQLTGIIVANGVSSTVGAASGSTAGTTRATGASEQEKRALAAVAIEDAAHFYSTGELRGVLPSAVVRVRALLPQGAEASDQDIVDGLVEAAESLLSGSHS